MKGSGHTRTSLAKKQTRQKAGEPALISPFILKAGLAAALLALAMAATFFLEEGVERIWVPQSVKALVGDDPAFSALLYDDRTWQDIRLNEISEMAGIIWIRASVELEATAVPRLPLALYLSGLFSAEVFWDGEQIGSKGAPGALAAKETPGPIDSVIYIPDHLTQPGRHLLALRTSAFHTGYAASQLIHDFSLGSFRADPRRELRYYALPLLLAGVFFLLGFQFLRVGRSAGAQAPVALAAFSLFVLLQLSAETSRAIIAYEYDLHLWRILVIWLAAVLAGLSLNLFVYLSTRWRPLLPLGVGALVLTLGFAWLEEGFDEKTVTAVRVLSILPIAAAMRQSRQGNRDLILVTLAILCITWILASIMSPMIFLDSSYYVTSAAFLSLTWFWISRGTISVETVTLQASPSQFISCKNQGQIERVPVKSVVYVQAAGNYAELICDNGRRILHHKRLGEIMSDPPEGFLRIHKSYAVNSAWVRKLNSFPGSRYSIHLLDGTEIPVSRYRVAEMRTALFEPGRNNSPQTE